MHRLLHAPPGNKTTSDLHSFFLLFNMRDDDIVKNRSTNCEERKLEMMRCDVDKERSVHIFGCSNTRSMCFVEHEMCIFRYDGIEAQLMKSVRGEG